MEGLNQAYADELAAWIWKEAKRLSTQAPAYQEKVFEVIDVSMNAGVATFLLHAIEFARICPEIFAVSNDLTRVRVRAAKSNSRLYGLLK